MVGLKAEQKSRIVYRERDGNLGTLFQCGEN